MTAQIVCKPGYNLGDTVIDGTGFGSEFIARMVGAKGVEFVLKTYNLTREQVLLACWFYACHTHRKSKLGKLWKMWTFAYYPFDDWSAVPDPPRLEVKR